MRLTKVLFAQHLGWHSKMKWRTMKRRTIMKESSVYNLKEMGIPVVDAIQELIPRPTIPDPPLVNQFLLNFFKEILILS